MNIIRRCVCLCVLSILQAITCGRNLRNPKNRSGWILIIRDGYLLIRREETVAPCLSLWFVKSFTMSGGERITVSGDQEGSASRCPVTRRGVAGGAAKGLSTRGEDRWGGRGARQVSPWAEGVAGAVWELWGTPIL